MESIKLHLIFTFLFVAVLASHAALPSVVYWHSMLPQTPMPKVVRDLLHNEWSDEKTTVDVGMGGVNVDTGSGNPVIPQDAKPSTSVGVGKGGVVVRTGRKKKPVYVGVTPSSNPFVYKYAATEDQLHDSANVALFFTEEDLKPGSTMNLHFVKTTARTAPAPTLLPRKVSESIPFSSKYIPEIYEKFSVAPDSKEAEIIKKTISECEEPEIKGEEKYCATSLESMIDFTISKMGKHVKAISTETEEKEPQKYTITGVKKVTDDKDDKAVVCHKLNYAYAVFYCHKTETTEAYEVSMVGEDGTKAKAAAVCHKDTSEWNPKHLAFQVLKVKPGTVPVCHFLPEDHIVWVNN